jgi:hypothetical protein
LRLVSQEALSLIDCRGLFVSTRLSFEHKIPLPRVERAAEGLYHFSTPRKRRSDEYQEKFA